MSVELLKTLSFASYVAAGVFFVVVIVLFFLFDIPGIIGNLSGATARKAIENIRQQTQDSHGVGVSSRYNASKTKIKGTVALPRNYIVGGDGSPSTQKFYTRELMTDSNETRLLNEQNETAVLKKGETAGSTEILYGDEAYVDTPQNTSSAMNVGFYMEVEMGFFGSSELIV